MIKVTKQPAIESIKYKMGIITYYRDGDETIVIKIVIDDPNGATMEEYQERAWNRLHDEVRSRDMYSICEASYSLTA